MEFTFGCPHCLQQLSASEDWTGKEVQCPTCTTSFVVPAPEESGSLEHQQTPLDSAAEVNTAPAEEPTPNLVSPDACDGFAETSQEPNEEAPALSQSLKSRQQVSTRSRRPKKAVTELLLSSFSLGQKQARLKKLQSIDLRKADSATGARAYEQRIFRDEFPDIFAQIESIDSDLAKLDEVSTDGHPSSIAARIMSAAEATKKKSKEQMLLIRRRNALCLLGASVRDSGFCPPELAEDIITQRDLAKRVAELNEEVRDLMAQTPVVLRRPLWIVAGVGLLALYLLLSPHIAIWTNRARANQAIAQINRQTSEAMSQISRDAGKFSQDTKQELADAQNEMLAGRREAVASYEKEIAEIQAKQQAELAPLKEQIVALEKEKEDLLTQKKSVLARLGVTADETSQ